MAGKAPPRPMTMIGVIGAGQCGGETAGVAEKVGELIARRGAALVCGGLGGVMESAARGAIAAGGVTIGVLPGYDRLQANPYISIPIVTDLGHARNVVIAHSAQAIIAIDGEYGTLSEIAVGLKLGKKVVALGKWSGIQGVITAKNPEEAVEKVFEKL